MTADRRSSVPAGLVERAVRETLRRERVPRAELSVAYLGDEEIAALHERHLDRAGPTDVLSFALHEADGDPLGDVYVGHAQALRQAGEAGVPPDEEMVRLAVHGTLHVLGHDHPSGPDRVRCPMYRLQEEIVRWACGAAAEASLGMNGRAGRAAAEASRA